MVLGGGTVFNDSAMSKILTVGVGHSQPKILQYRV